MTITQHIRRPVAPRGGNQFYKDRSVRVASTYCGAPATRRQKIIVAAHQKPLTLPSMTTTATPELNGNPYVKVPHVFVPGEGCFFETREMAIHQGISPNGVGLWVKELVHEGKTYFKAGNTNVWN